MYRIVVNADGRTSLWRADKQIPAGWTAAGFDGSREECLAEIERRGPVERPADATGTETLVTMVERTVAKFPDRPAASDDERSLTYTELRSRANALARTLVSEGVRPGDRVVVYMERGVDIFVAVLGILKAGAAYVAIDTRYPDARRDLMIEGGRARRIITQPGWKSKVEHVGVEVLEWRSEPGEDPGAPDAGIRSGHAASVLFTSGSSGKPKAIVLEHGNLLYFARNSRLPDLVPADRTGQVSSLSFDAFHFEAWGSFAAGAEVVVLPAMADLIANDLQRELRRRRITAMLAPTMAINHVVHEDRDAFAPLRVLHTGGDVIQPAAVREIMAGSFTGEFYNLYGPAEGTTACTSYLTNILGQDEETVPIGTPLDGAAVYVLDSDLSEVPAGTAGELHIGGAGVTRGYLGQEALTAERFLPDPFGAPGSRMYATGDLARRRPDGLLEFLGRADDQVKIRGYRVEPREVERLLSQHPLVREAAVLAEGDDHDRRLVALVVAYDRLPPKQLRDFAVEQMPDYLVPSAIVQVPEIPGNDHGKRDLAKLRKLAADHVRRRAERVEPRDETERYLVGLWEDLLAVEWIGATDDFFALGGNSLLAFRVQRRIKRELGVTLDVREILDTSDLAKLAALIRERKEVTPHEHAVGSH
jgi:amino acid adenylation domain-containing protein